MYATFFSFFFSQVDLPFLTTLPHSDIFWAFLQKRKELLINCTFSKALLFVTFILPYRHQPFVICAFFAVFAPPFLSCVQTYYGDTRHPFSFVISAYFFFAAVYRDKNFTYLLRSSLSAFCSNSTASYLKQNESNTL